MYIIARDGSGDFTTIQQAVDTVPAGNTRPVILLVRMNEYPGQVVIDRDHIRLMGEARDRTVISSPEGEALTVTSRHVTVENLTVRSGERTAVHDALTPAAPTIFLCGDETALPLYDALCALAPGLAVENLAAQSRSCKAFVTEKRLGYAELCLHAGDVLLISFAAGAPADPTLPLYLNMFVDAALERGAIPVLCCAAALAEQLRPGARLLDAADPAGAVRTLLQLMNEPAKEARV